jgi:hypothetical protein
LRNLKDSRARPTISGVAKSFHIDVSEFLQGPDQELAEPVLVPGGRGFQPGRVLLLHTEPQLAPGAVKHPLDPFEVLGRGHLRLEHLVERDEPNALVQHKDRRRDYPSHASASDLWPASASLR